VGPLGATPNSAWGCFRCDTQGKPWANQSPPARTLSGQTLGHPTGVLGKAWNRWRRKLNPPPKSIGPIREQCGLGAREELSTGVDSEVLWISFNASVIKAYPRRGVASVWPVQMDCCWSAPRAGDLFSSLANWELVPVTVIGMPRREQWMGV
jgi:hypothetical protein